MTVTLLEKYDSNENKEKAYSIVVMGQNKVQPFCGNMLLPGEVLVDESELRSRGQRTVKSVPKRKAAVVTMKSGDVYDLNFPITSHQFEQTAQTQLYEEGPEHPSQKGSAADALQSNGR
ncbi:hypothetical protein STEG23_032215, partial [Scotinomys teguina]